MSGVAPNEPLTLSFNYLLETDGIALRDLAEVEILTSGGTVVELVARNRARFTSDSLDSRIGSTPPVQLGDPTTTNTANPWRRMEIDVARFAGQTIQVRFKFDTVTGGFNTHKGFHVDDVVIATRSADIEIRRGAPTGALYQTGPLSVTTGDFDDNGKIDLAIGEPTTSVVLRSGTSQQTLTTSNRGRVEIFTDLVDAGRQLHLDDGDKSISGGGSQDQFGSLSITPNLDFNFDGISDLLVGAGRADGGFVDNGKVYALTGRSHSYRSSFPANPQTLGNLMIGGNSFVASSAEGQPVLFSAGELGTGAAAELWFSFRTLNAATANDFVQVLSADPLAGAEDRLVFDLFDSSGRPISLARSTADLRRLPAGQYYLRVHDAEPGEGWRSGPITFEVHLAAAPQNRPASNTATYADRDRLDGGNGNDTLIGNEGLDRIYAGSGTNRVTAESFELMDDTSGTNLVSLPPLSERAGNNPYTPSNEVVSISDPVLLNAIRSRLGRDQNDPRPLTQSDLAGLTSLHLSGVNPTTIWSNLSLAKNLVSLWIDSATSGDATVLGSLKQLRTLSLTNATLTNYDFLTSLPQLASLRLVQSNYTGTPLPTALRKLDLFGATMLNQANLEAQLPQLTALEDLSLAYVPMSEFDLATLDTLPNLSRLDLTGMGRTQLNGLSNPSIETLIVVQNSLTDLTELLPLANLHLVYAYTNPLSNQAYAVTLPEILRRGRQIFTLSDTSVAAIEVLAEDPLLPGVYAQSPLVFQVIRRDPNPGNGSAFDFSWTIRNAANQVVATGNQPGISYLPLSSGRLTIELIALDNDDLVGGLPRQYSTSIRLDVFDKPAMQLDYGDPGVSQLQINEGGTASFSVYLDRPPIETVYVHAYNGNLFNGFNEYVPGLQFDSTPDLMFDESNWNIPQSITVSVPVIDSDIADSFGKLTFSLDRRPQGDGTGFVAGLANVVVIDQDRQILLLNVGDPAVVDVAEGGSIDIQVQLSAQPTADLTLDISRLSGDADIATTSTSLTFTTSDWNVPQTITFTAGDDDDATAGSATFLISGTLLPDGLVYSKTFDVREVDNDPMDILVSTTSLVVPESASGSFSVSLSARPSANVIVNLNASAGSDPDLFATATLTFTPANWNVPQDVAVTSLNDADAVDGLALWSITADGWTTASVTATEADDDRVLITTVDTVIGEGGVALIGVWLGGQPDSTVQVSANLSGDPDFTFGGPSSISFSVNTWNVPKFIPITALDDADGIDGIGQLSWSASGWTGAVVNLREQDDDRQIVVVGPLGILEGTSATVDVSLSAQPAGDVTVTVNWDGGDDDLSIESGTILLFNASNWNVPQQVTVAAAPDADMVSGTASFLAAADDWNPASITIAEIEDGRWLELSPVTLSVPENGERELRLRLLYSADETIVNVTLSELLGNDPDLTHDSDGTFEFNSSNWNVWQTITFSAASDNDTVDGLANYRFSAAGQTDVLLTVQEMDNRVAFETDVAELIVQEGRTATLAVRLKEQPVADLVISAGTIIGDGDLALDASSPTSLTFSRSNWNQYQKFVFAAAADADAEDGTALVTLTSAGLPSLEVTLRELDDARRVVPTAVLIDDRFVIDEGTSRGFDVTLGTAPSEVVIVSVSLLGEDSSFSLLSPTELTFTPLNWNVPQSVTVAAAHDDDAVDSENVIQLSANGWITSLLTLREDDDDTAALVVQPLSGLDVSEDGTVTATFVMHLQSKPGHEVEVPVFTSNPAEGASLTRKVIFRPDNWNIPQTITVTGVDDFVDDGDVGFDLFFGPSVSTSLEYAGLTTASFQMTNADNDTAGIVVGPLSGPVISEGGTSVTFTVVLNSQPTAVVRVPIGTSDSAESSANVSEVVFTPSNWSVPQTITITGVDDLINDGDQVVSVTFAPSISADPMYDSIALTSLLVKNLDDDYLPAASTVVTESLTFGGVTYYAGSTKATGTELWRTVGTSSGTALVADLMPGGDSSNVAELVELSGKLFFVADTPTAGRELRVFDPATAAVSLAFDALAGTAHGSPEQLTVVGNTLFFTASDGLAGRDLWKLGSDGTPTLLRSFGNSAPTELTAFDGKLFFVAAGPEGRELWASDGTGTGTALFADLRIGARRFGHCRLNGGRRKIVLCCQRRLARAGTLDARLGRRCAKHGCRPDPGYAWFKPAVDYSVRSRRCLCRIDTRLRK